MQTTRTVSRRYFVGVAAAVGAMMLAGCASSQPASSTSADTSGSAQSAGAASSSEGSSASSAEAASSSSSESGKSAVVFFSQTGNTAAVAALIANHLHIDALELKAIEPYTEEDLDYDDSSTRATVEQNTPEARPGIVEIPDLAAYDTVFVGYPIWWGKAPRLMCTFVEGCDLSGKTIVPFCTSGSSGIGSSPDELADLGAKDAQWLSGKRFAAGADGDTVAQWVDSLSL